MIGESINFMITGMSVVFMFLVRMVFVLKAQGALVGSFFNKEESKNSSSNDKDQLGAEKVAIISAAVKHHIEQTKKP